MTTTEYDKTTVRWHRVPEGYLSDQIVLDWRGETTENGEPETQVWQYRAHQTKKRWDGRRWRQGWLLGTRSESLDLTRKFPASCDGDSDYFGTLTDAKAYVQKRIDSAVERGATVTIKTQAGERK
jgi:hypothetical protein